MDFFLLYLIIIFFYLEFLFFPIFPRAKLPPYGECLHKDTLLLPQPLQTPTYPLAQTTLSVTFKHFSEKFAPYPFYTYTQPPSPRFLKESLGPSSEKRYGLAQPGTHSLCFLSVQTFLSKIKRNMSLPSTCLEDKEELEHGN